MREARKAKGWSQGVLASAAGVSQGTIGNVESGIRDEPRELLSIARALGVSPDWLKTGAPPRSGNEAPSQQEDSPSMLQSLGALDMHLAKMTPEIQAAGRATLGKWAAGTMSSADAAKTLEALISASQHLGNQSDS